jgi:hypothetical protein
MQDRHELNSASHDSPVVFRPDADVVPILQEAAERQAANLQLKFEVTDLRNGHNQTVFVRWESGNVENLLLRVESSLEVDPALDQYEYYFWLFWRGWCGCLDAEMLVDLPAVSPDMIEKVNQGVPLRDSDLRRLATALEWAYADAAGEWGSKESWMEGTISPGHLSQRKKMGNFIRQRMIELHGPDFESAPIDS